MATLNRNIQTNAGAKLWATAISGENKIIYSKAELYAKKIKSLTDSQIADLTNVDTPLLNCNLTVTNMSDQNIRLSAEFTNDTLQHDIAFNSIGWFATTVVDKAQGKEPVLFAVSEIDTESNLIAPTENSSTSFFLAQLSMGISNTNNVQLIAGTTGFVKFPDLEQRILQLANQGLIDLGNKLSQDTSVLDLHNTSLHYVPYGTVKGLPATKDDSNLGGFLISMGNGAITQDGVQIYFEPLSHKTFISYFLTKNNAWSKWIEVGSQSYTKDEIAKILDNYATNEDLNQKADLSNVYNKEQIDNEFKQVTNNMVTSVDNIIPKDGNVSLDGKYATPDDLKGTSKNLLDFIKQLKVFNSDDMTTVENSAIDLDLIKYKQTGIIKFTNCNLKVANFQSEISLNNDNEIITPNQIIEGGRSLSGWIINIPIEHVADDPTGKEFVYQYVIVSNGKYNEGIIGVSANIYQRKVIVAEDDMTKKFFPLIDITVSPTNIANTAVSAAVGNAIRLKQFYADRKIDGVVSTTYQTINLDNLQNLNKYVGITRFDNCLLKTVSIPPFDDGENSTQDLLYSQKSLSGWLIMLPTNSEKINGLANFPLQIVICYKTDRGTSLDTEPEVVNNMEIYYRILNTSNKYDSSNYLRKFVNNSATTRIELTRQNFDFNNMIYSTEGETTLEKVMKSSNSNSYKKAKDVSLPLLFDLITGSENISDSNFKFTPDCIPFSYKIISERLTNSSQNVIYVHQEIRCLGFIFYREGSILPTSSGASSRKFDDWILKGTYNPISEYNNPMGDGSGLNQQINAFVLPDGSDINFVGTTTYSDYKLTHSSAPSIRFYPQGTYFLDAHSTYGGQPEDNYNGYLVAMQTGLTRLQFISYIKTGETTNYIRSGGPTAIGQWRLI